VASAKGSLACNRRNSLQFISSGWDGNCQMWQRKGGVVKTVGNLLYILMTDIAKGSDRRN